MLPSTSATLVCFSRWACLKTVQQDEPEAKAAPTATPAQPIQEAAVAQIITEEEREAQVNVRRTGFPLMLYQRAEMDQLLEFAFLLALKTRHVGLLCSVPRSSV